MKAQHVSSGIPLIIRSSNCICSLWFTYAMWWPAVVKSEFPLRLDYGRSPHAYVNQRLQIQLELLMMSGVPLETCWAFNERWNNKLWYKVASCWLFLLSFSFLLKINNLCNGMTIQKLCAICYINSQNSGFFYFSVENCLIVCTYALNRIWTQSKRRAHVCTYKGDITVMHCWEAVFNCSNVC